MDFIQYADDRISQYVLKRVEENKPISGNLLEKEDGANAHFYRQKGNSIKGLISWNEDL